MLMTLEKRARGRGRRVPGEPIHRIKVSFAVSEFELLKAVAALNFVTIAEFLRDAANDAAEECGAARPCVERRSRERRRQTQPRAVERRTIDRRSS